jgi:hypothetical protein
MQHLRVATYKINQGSFQEIADTAKTGMLKTFQTKPGFISYGLADTGDRTCLSISLWKTHADAEASVPVAASWVRENLRDRVELKSTYVGDLAFFEPVPASV